MNGSEENKYDLAVIGGGPAGMMAAGRAAERGLKVILIEKNPSLGKKLLITGGGRCNLTNNILDNRAFLDKFGGSGKFLFSAFAEHSVKETLEFFHAQGMETKEEEGHRIFPASNSSKSVWDAMVKYMEKGKVTVMTGAKVTGFKTESGKIKSVALAGRKEVRAESFVLATGGKSHPETGSTGEGFDWLSKLGHKIVEPEASLVPITVKDSWVKALSGVSLPEAKLTIFANGKKAAGKGSVIRGKILFTHFGLSGPAILNASNRIGELMKYSEVVLSLDLIPSHDYSTLNTALQELFAKESNKKFKNAITELIPAAFATVVLERSGIDPDIQCNSVTREARLALVRFLKDIHIHPTGLLGEDKAIITSGGVSLEEVDFRTMRSRLISNLYLVGDVLDVDRPSGGFSLQLCWTTGFVAGNSAEKASS